MLAVSVSDVLSLSQAFAAARREHFPCNVTRLRACEIYWLRVYQKRVENAIYDTRKVLPVGNRLGDISTNCRISCKLLDIK